MHNYSEKNANDTTEMSYFFKNESNYNHDYGIYMDLVFLYTAGKSTLIWFQVDTSQLVSNCFFIEMVLFYLQIRTFDMIS